MEGRFRNILLAYSLPTIAIITLYWIRRKRKIHCQSDSDNLKDQTVSIENCSQLKIGSELENLVKVEPEFEKLHVLESNSVNVSMDDKILNSNSNSNFIKSNPNGCEELEKLSQVIETRLDIKSDKVDDQKSDDQKVDGQKNDDMSSKPNFEPVINEDLSTNFVQNDAIHSNDLKHIEKFNNGMAFGLNFGLI